MKAIALTIASSLALFFCGCESPEPGRQASEAEAMRISTNWPKLKAGMTYAEVDRLLDVQAGSRLAGVNPEILAFQVKLQSTSPQARVNHPRYTLEFANDKLVKWTLH